MKKQASKTNVPKTREELIEQAWKQEKTLPHFNSLGAPTYSYTEGDRVILGGLKNCTVAAKRFSESGVLLYCIEHDDGKTGEKHYTCAPWYHVRPLSTREGETDFTKVDDIDIRFLNKNIESLLNMYYLHGVEMNPPYQRGYVWDDEDKESLLDSIFTGIEIGKFAFITKDWTHEKHLEILDGKQRLSTLLDFYENRLAYKGKYFNDLSPRDRHTFLDTNITVGEASDLTPQQIYTYFYKLNKCGKVMDEEHLNEIKAMAQMEDNSIQEEVER